MSSKSNAAPIICTKDDESKDDVVPRRLPELFNDLTA
jgi:hypothetical protein